ncbi:MAG: hypothetical protein WBQ73_00810, partial [Candidatus Babeliales bacterium]
MARKIKDLLPLFFSKRVCWKIELLNAWPTLFSEFNVKITLEKILDELLVLGVSDSCWMQELY